MRTVGDQDVDSPALFDRKVGGEGGGVKNEFNIGSICTKGEGAGGGGRGGPPLSPGLTASYIQYETRHGRGE